MSSMIASVSGDPEEAGDPIEPEPSAGRNSMVERKVVQSQHFRWVPLAPLVAAMSLGIVVDRFLDPWATRTWIHLILACGAVSILVSRRELLSCIALLVAVWAVGGGWHHYWWTERNRDDLSWSITETPPIGLDSRRSCAMPRRARHGPSAHGAGSDPSPTVRHGPGPGS